MIHRKYLLLVVLACAIGGLSAQEKKTSGSPPMDVQKQRMEQEIARLSLLSGGTVGVSAIHVESGMRIVQNGKTQFPMASSYKVPIAIKLLSRVDSGKYSMDQLIEIEKSDLHPGSGMLSDRFNWPGAVKPGIALSIRSLMELMLLISDNSATDICLRLAGGPAAVNAHMKKMGIEGVLSRGLGARKNCRHLGGMSCRLSSESLSSFLEITLLKAFVNSEFAIWKASVFFCCQLQTPSD